MKPILFLLAFCFGCSAGEVWLTPVAGTGDVTNGVHGSGTFSDPYQTPTAWAFDWLLTGRIGPTNSIRLHPGRFHTAGVAGVSPYGVQFKDEWKFRGSGVDVTTIVLDPLTNAPNPISYWSILGGRQSSAASGATDGAEVSDLTIDMNVPAHATNPGVRFGAVLLGGNNVKISRVKVINWGSTVDVEQFLLVINQHAGGVWGGITTNCVIEDCIIGPPSPVLLKGGTSAICIIGNPPNDAEVGPGWILGAEIRGCFVNGVATASEGGMGTPKYFNALGMGATVQGRVRRNVVSNITGPSSAACYWECDSNFDFAIEDNTFLDVLVGIFLRGEICDSPAIFRRNITFRNNLITLKTGGIGIVLSGKPGISIPTRLDIVGNTIHARHGAGPALQAINIRHADHVLVANNTLDAGGGVDLLFGAGVTAATATNNVKLGGGLITAKRPAVEELLKKIQVDLKELGLLLNP